MRSKKTKSKDLKVHPALHGIQSKIRCPMKPIYGGKNKKIVIHLGLGVVKDAKKNKFKYL